jgi:predicted metal-dependent HD superfamily phosphohydrolase
VSGDLGALELQVTQVENPNHPAIPLIKFIQWYNGPDRFYHNLEHIYDCLKKFGEIRHLLVDPISVWLAIWFHDCVYSTLPNAKNEELSAAEARRWIADESRKRGVTNLILVTKHSELYPPMTTDEMFMADIDLSSLGASLDQFDINSANIREEYRRYDDLVYNQGRIDILFGFLDRAMQEKLYYTAYFRDRYQVQAIENLTWEIDRLTNELEYLRRINTAE